MTPQPAGPEKKKSTLTIVLLVLGIGGGCCVVGGGIMAAIAIPNFIKFQARSKEAECRTNLKSLYASERALFEDKNLYSENPDEAGFSPEAHYYVYVMSHSGAPLGKATDAVQLAGAARSHMRGVLGVDGKCPDCSFTAACAGNLDSDSEVDVWSISTRERQGPNGQTIMAGELFHDFDDVTDAPAR